jgi:dihydroxy-acid dehydratase
MLVDMRPSGSYQMETFFAAGGVPALLKELAPLLETAAVTVNGGTLQQQIDDAPAILDRYREVIARLDTPLRAEGGLSVLRGSLAPDGAILKHAAASPRLLQHRGRAVVFSGPADLHARIDDPDLDVTADDVLVMQNVGPVGGPGMPEAGLLPLPRKVLAQGVRDMVRISDGRMSGTAFGTVVLHVAPESAVGGPLGLVRDGDLIELDQANRRLELLVSADELDRRRAEWRPPQPAYRRGYRRLFLEHVLQAPRGCDFDFLVSEEAASE